MTLFQIFFWFLKLNDVSYELRSLYNSNPQYDYKDYYAKNRDNIIDKRNSIRNLNTFYNSYITEAIAWHDYTECSEDGFLIVKCKYCGNNTNRIKK